ncbi:MAG: N-6 DNA methylase, partial [Candidatus Helarchaeota archaeon]
MEDIEAINRFFISLPTIDLDKDLKKVDEIYKRFQNIFGKNEDILGKLYEFYLNSENIRKNSGIYYTPKYIIEYIIKNTIGILFDKLISTLIKEFNHNDFKKCDNTIEKIVNIKILDPACGSGTFLISAFNMIWNKYKKIEKLFEKINDNNNLMDA